MTLKLATLFVAASCISSCYLFPGETIGSGEISAIATKDAAGCCAACNADTECVTWTFHKKFPSGTTKNCFLKDNTTPLQPPRPVDKNNETLSGLTEASATCTPNATPVMLCPQGFPCPTCGTKKQCSCYTPHPPKPVPPSPTKAFACLPGRPGADLPFCDMKLAVEDRVKDLISRINDTDKPNLLTARGKGGNGAHMQALPALGVPAYYWGYVLCAELHSWCAMHVPNSFYFSSSTNCLHSLNGGQCVLHSDNTTHCPTNFPSGPSFGATFDRELIKKMANVIGVELRAMFVLGLNKNSIDCWGPVVNLNRDPRWGRNGEGGSEDAYLMGELAKEWAQGFQSPRPSLLNSSREILQGIITLKHMAVNSVENTAPFNRHNFDANETYGVDNFVLADYYLRPFKSAIAQGGAVSGTEINDPLACVTLL
jgi:hypothetical protein